ncbi:hypothetical protein AAY473_019165, partial [Plecturocebus cupreus]
MRIIHAFCGFCSIQAGITGTCHHTWIIFVLLIEIDFHHVGQHVGFKLLTSSDLPTLASLVLECSDVITAYCSLDGPGSSDPPALASGLSNPQSRLPLNSVHTHPFLPTFPQWGAEVSAEGRG